MPIASNDYQSEDSPYDQTGMLQNISKTKTYLLLGCQPKPKPASSLETTAPAWP
jgi:hypothetical protein